MAQDAGVGGKKAKPKSYKDWSAAVNNDKKLTDLAKKTGRAVVNSTKSGSPTSTSARFPVPMGTNKNVPQTYGVRPPSVVAKNYGGKGTPNSPAPKTTNAKTPKPPVRVASTNAATPKPALKPTPKPGAAPYRPPSAPVVAPTSRTPAPPTVNGRPVSKSNPIPAKKAAPAKKTPAQLETERKMREQAYWDPFNKQAKSSVEAQNLPALNEIQRQMDEVAKRGERAAADMSERGKREQENLAEIYDRLGNFYNEVQGAQDANYNALRTSASGAYDQLAQSLNKTFDASQATAASEASRLGLSHTADPNGASERDQAYLTGLAGVDKAATMGGFNQMEAGFDQVMNRSTMNAGSEGAMRQAVSMRETNKSLEELTFELETALRNLGGKRLDIKSVEGQQIAELARALEDKQYSRTAEQKQQEFANNLATKNFDLNAQQARAAMMPQAPQPPSDLEILQAARLKQELMNNAALTEAQIAATSSKTAPQIRRTVGGQTAWF